LNFSSAELRLSSAGAMNAGLYPCSLIRESY
jgi:hypothetical protein